MRKENEKKPPLEEKNQKANPSERTTADQVVGNHRSRGCCTVQRGGVEVRPTTELKTERAGVKTGVKGKVVCTENGKKENSAST